MKIEVDKSILEKLKNEIIEYQKSIGFIKFKDDINLVKENLNSLKHIYVDDIIEVSEDGMISKKEDIIIDSKFVNTSKDSSKVTGFKPNLLNIIGNRIIHELWHRASTHSGISGIIEGNNIRKYNALNEGITQMLTEDITGVVICKLSDKYKDYKKMAKIIRTSISTSTILSAYINHEDSIRLECNKLANNDNFYDEFNRSISEIYEIKKRIKKLESKRQAKTSLEFRETFKKLYNDKMFLQYKNLILNIIIPKLKRLNKDTSKSYIEDILNSVKDDKKVYDEFYRYLIKYLSYDRLSKNEENKKIREKLKSLDHQQQFMYNFARDSKSVFKSKIITAEENGTLYYRENGKIVPIKSTQMSMMIYRELWNIEEKNIDNDTLKQIISKGLAFGNKKAPLEKNKIFCGVKAELEKKGLIVINSLKEIDSDYLKLNYLNQNKFPTLSDLRMLTDNYELHTLVSKDGAYVSEIINRTTNEIADTEFLEDNAMFANLWMVAVSKFTQRNIYIDRVDQVFSKNIEKLYNEFIEISSKQLIENDKIKKEEIIKHFENNSYYFKVITELLSDKDNCDWIYRFLRRYSIKKKPSLN
ncbi:MAG: hypothetical protein IKJ43_04395 [Bacilli bacterium]|nr:hypothetical protein [Bacilli bacterium]